MRLLPRKQFNGSLFVIVVGHRTDRGYNIITTHYFQKSGTNNLISYRNVDSFKKPNIEAYTHGTGMKCNMGIYVLCKLMA